MDEKYFQLLIFRFVTIPVRLLGIIVAAFLFPIYVGWDYCKLLDNLLQKKFEELTEDN